MIGFPNAKINLGLQIRRKRNDGFHDIETVMYPFGLADVLEIIESKTGKTTMLCTGFAIDNTNPGCAPAGKPFAVSTNLVFRIYELLKENFGLHPVSMHLHKAIPTGAGLGGGSSDCAFALKMLNELFKLELNPDGQQQYVSQLGSDCAFFLDNLPAIATGRGEILQPVNLDLKGYHIYIVKPNININTRQAYSWVKPCESRESLPGIVSKPLTDWKYLLFNDFENPIFERYPMLRGIKQKLYQSGALYAAMSGSGSALFGIFEHIPTTLAFPENYFQWSGVL